MGNFILIYMCLILVVQTNAHMCVALNWYLYKQVYLMFFFLIIISLSNGNIIHYWYTPYSIILTNEILQDELGCISGKYAAKIM